MNAIRWQGGKWRLVLAAVVALGFTAEGRAASGPYHVYGGQCPKSWRLLGTYPSDWAACHAAAGFRHKGNRVEVTTGTAGQYPFGKEPALYEVSRCPCKAWYPHGFYDSFLEAADGFLDVLDTGDSAEIIYHYAPAKQAQAPRYHIDRRVCSRSGTWLRLGSYDNDAQAYFALLEMREKLKKQGDYGGAAALAIHVGTLDEVVRATWGNREPRRVEVHFSPGTRRWTRRTYDSTREALAAVDDALRQGLGVEIIYHYGV
jgi:hypothetical protein